MGKKFSEASESGRQICVNDVCLLALVTHCLDSPSGKTLVSLYGRLLAMHLYNMVTFCQDNPTEATQGRHTSCGDFGRAQLLSKAQIQILLNGPGLGVRSHHQMGTNTSAWKNSGGAKFIRGVWKVLGA